MSASLEKGKGGKRRQARGSPGTVSWFFFLWLSAPKRLFPSRSHLSNYTHHPHNCLHPRWELSFIFLSWERQPFETCSTLRGRLHRCGSRWTAPLALGTAFPALGFMCPLFCMAAAHPTAVSVPGEGGGEPCTTVQPRSSVSCGVDSWPWESYTLQGTGSYALSSSYCK